MTTLCIIILIHVYWIIQIYFPLNSGFIIYRLTIQPQNKKNVLISFNNGNLSQTNLIDKSLKFSIIHGYDDPKS